MLYPGKEEKQLDRELFRNPSSEYRGAPFWAWNCRVTKEQIDWQTECLRRMGMGGAHIHCRTGMNIPYMSDEFMDLVSYAHEKFAGKGMLTWLYDEDRWPSGFGGGLVTVHPEYRERYLVLYSGRRTGNRFPLPDTVTMTISRNVLHRPMQIRLETGARNMGWRLPGI